MLHNPTWVQPGADFELDTGTCDHGYPSEGFIQFACEEEQHLGGVVGGFLHHATLAKAVALIAERSETNLLQILGSPSSALHDRVQYPYLFHMIPSSAWCCGSMQFDRTVWLD